jgi:hypothetical protein
MRVLQKPRPWLLASGLRDGVNGLTRQESYDGYGDD